MFKEYGNTIIYGKNGTGKSYLIHRYLDEIIKSNDDYRLILVDFKSNEFNKYKTNDNLLKIYSFYTSIVGKGLDDEETLQKNTILDIEIYRKFARLWESQEITEGTLDQIALNRTMAYRNRKIEQILDSLLGNKGKKIYREYINALPNRISNDKKKSTQQVQRVQQLPTIQATLAAPSSKIISQNVEVEEFSIEKTTNTINAFEVLNDIWDNYLKHRENIKDNSDKPIIYIFIDELNELLSKRNDQIYNRLIEIIKNSVRLNVRIIVSSQNENLFNNDDEKIADTVINLNHQERIKGNLDDIFNICVLKNDKYINPKDNMYKIKNKLHIIWAKKCTEKEALLKFNEGIKKFHFLCNDASNKNKIKQLILYDSYGVKIKSES